MARPTTVSGSKLLIYVESPAGSGTFVAPCGLTTKGINFSTSSNETNVPDCDDPDLPAWTERDVTALSAGVSGSGVLATESLQLWETWYFSGESRKCRVVIDHASGRMYTGDFVLSSWNVGGERGNRATVEVSLDSDGEITPAAAP